jgi:hypothetical protein
MFLQQYEPNIKVYFIGENPQKKGDFGEAMTFWNQVEIKNGILERIFGVMAGPHCLTFEDETEDHTA